MENRDAHLAGIARHAEHAEALNLELVAYSVGDAISGKGHVLMLGAVQPFLSGAVSKAVNLPSDATAQDIANLVLEAWKHGVKALAVYRDGSRPPN